METQIHKNTLRQEIKTILAKIPEKLLDNKSTAIAATLCSTSFWQEADIIFLYLSFGSEVKTDHMVLRGIFENKIVAIPRISGKSMDFHQIKNLDKYISFNRFGIREPAPSLPLAEPDLRQKYLVITPGLAFDREKNRLGRGGGFYDRFLSKIKQGTGRGMVLGICFDEQLVVSVPVSSHDIKVDAVVTDKEIIW